LKPHALATVAQVVYPTASRSCGRIDTRWSDEQSFMSRRGKSITILVVGPFPSVTEGLAALLSKEADYVVSVGALDGADEVVRGAPAPGVEVAVVAVDGRDVESRDVLAQMSRLAAVVPIVVLSSFADRAQVSAAIGAGARACVAARTRSASLVDAVRAVAEGRGYLCPISADLLVRSEATAADVAVARTVALTARERQVLALVVKGRTNAQIAESLSLSVKTVHAHRANVMRKLGVRNASMLVREALRLGLIPPR
jgi:DNA-binding NarL/FixJ family response regulator